MEINAFQLHKNDHRTNVNTNLHNTPIIHYGKIVKIIDVQTVIVKTVIQVSSIPEVYTVTLFNLSSALLEVNAYPKFGDTVLLLFLQRHDPRMFVEESINNQNATGYNQFSGVGILMSTARNIAHTIMSFYEDGGKPIAKLQSDAEWRSTFNGSMAMTFCRAIVDSDDEQLITLCFGQGRPFVEMFLSKVTREHGFWKNGKGELIPLDAAVTERYSEYAPISKDIQGKQTYKIGIGEDGDTEAPVDVEMGEKADVAINSKSGMTMRFEKAVLAECGDTYELRITGAVTFSSDDTITIDAGANTEVKAKGKIYVGNTEMDAHTLFLDLTSEIKSLQMFGPPNLHKVHPDSIASLTAYEQEVDALFMLGEEGEDNGGN